VIEIRTDTRELDAAKIDHKPGGLIDLNAAASSTSLQTLRPISSVWGLGAQPRLIGVAERCRRLRDRHGLSRLLEVRVLSARVQLSLNRRFKRSEAFRNLADLVEDEGVNLLDCLNGLLNLRHLAG